MVDKPVVAVLLVALSAAAAPVQAQDRAAASQPTLESLSIPELLDTAKRGLATGYTTAARRALDLILERDPANIEAMMMFAEEAEKVRDLETARTQYRRIRDIDPSHFGANLGLGRVWSDGRLWRQAIVYLETAESVAPPDRRSEVQTKLAIAYHGLHQVIRAEEIARKAVAGAPEDFDAREVLAGIQLEMREFDRAIETSEGLVDLARRRASENPGDVESLRRMARAYSRLIDSLRYYHQTLYETNDAGEFVDRLTPGNERRAAEVLNRIREARELQAQLNLTLAYHDIIPSAERAVAYQPDNIEYLHYLGLLYRRTSQIDKAISVFQRVLERDSTHAGAKAQLLEFKAPLTTRPAEDGGLLSGG